MIGGTRDDVLLVVSGRQLDEGVEAGGDAGDPHPERVSFQRGHQPVSPAAIDEPRSPDVAVVGAGDDELGERELVDRAGVPVRQGLGRADLVDQPPREHKPTQPQARRECLARGPGIDDLFWGQALQRPEWMAVVAELAVVVVLDDQAAGVERPLDNLCSPSRRERHSERELVRRGQEHGVSGSELAHPGAALVDRERRQRQPILRGGLARALLDELLDREGRGAARPEHPAEQPEPLREATADDDVLRAGANAASPAQVVGERAAQLRQPARIRVTERVVGRHAERPARRREPRRPGKSREVGGAGAQVVAGLREDDRLGRGSRVRWRGPPRHPGARTPHGGEPALGDQLTVGIGHGVPGDAEISGQCAGGRQPRSGSQTAAGNRLSQSRLERGPDSRPLEIQVQVDARNGPFFCH